MLTSVHNLPLLVLPAWFHLVGPLKLLRASSRRRSSDGLPKRRGAVQEQVIISSPKHICMYACVRASGRPSWYATNQSRQHGTRMKSAMCQRVYRCSLTGTVVARPLLLRVGPENVFGQNMTEHNPAPSPSGHPLLSGPPSGRYSPDIHPI